ncbi:hypothetical protein [Marinobacter sp. X15-166B]|uniref:hypothetical protein n=1 Tax=Marinobacter sp. X15-166B TaxID=1897620 RepID=UPI00085C3AF3|nr:hypothetical protein [Marinobacter sp. X15-166B]OEY66898.1 hypothetical protein BG841_10810 [Marinobacter sp. X15-166B]
MPDRSELVVAPSMAAGLLAAAPWIVLLASTLVTSWVGTPLLLIFVPVALGGALTEVHRCGLLRSPRSVVRLAMRGRELRAELGDGREFPVSVSADSRLTARVALLKIIPCAPTSSSAHPLATVVLLGGSGRFNNIRSQPFREFRVWLRLNRSLPETA